MDAARRGELLSRLQRALALTCRNYRGVKETEVQTLLDDGRIVHAYFLMTQTSQEVANETKKAFFLPVSKTVGKTGRDWTALAEKTTEWWTVPENDDDDELKRRLRARDNLRRVLESPNDGPIPTRTAAFRFSASPRTVGTYLHEAYGATVAYECGRMLGKAWETLEHVVPGRMVHSRLPFMGVTPDAVSMIDEAAFHSLTQKLFSRDDRTEEQEEEAEEAAATATTARERESGAPRMTLEIKTIHGPSAVSESDVSEIWDVFRATEEEEKEEKEGDDDTVDCPREPAAAAAAKAAALELLRDKLERGKWMPRNLRGDHARERHFVKRHRTKGSRQSGPACAFFQRTTRMYPREEFDRLKVEYVTGEIYPNFASRPRQQQKKKTNAAATAAAEKNTPGTEPTSARVELRKLTKPGKACMVLYDIRRGKKNGVLMRLNWDAAPLVLTLNCDYFNQVLGQRCVAKQYGRDVDLRSVFAVVLPSATAPDRMALMYAYDTGITDYAMECYENVLIREIGSAMEEAAVAVAVAAKTRTSETTAASEYEFADRDDDMST